MATLAPHTRGVLLAAGAMILISPDGLVIRMSGAGDLALLFWRSAGAIAAISLLLVLMRPGGLVGTLRRLNRPTMLFAVLMLASNALFVTSITRTAVANTLVILAAVPLFAGILGWVLLREKVALHTSLAIGAALVGIFVIVGGSLQTGNLVGDLLAVASAFMLASKVVLMRRFPDTDILLGIGIGGVLTAIAVAPFVTPLAIGTQGIVLATATGVFALSVAAVLFFMAARHLPPAETGLFAILETVLGPLWVWLVLDEQPPLATIAGGIIILVTLALHSAASSWHRSRTRAVRVP